MNKALVKFYASQVKKDRMKITDVDEEYRDAVKAVINGEPIQSAVTVNSPAPVAESVTNQPYGAYELDNIDAYGVSRSNDKYFANVQILHSGLFPTSLRDGKPMPENIEVDAMMVSSMSPKVEESSIGYAVKPMTNGFILETSFNIHDGCEIGEKEQLVRIDLGIKSSNYDDMRVTVCTNS